MIQCSISNWIHSWWPTRMYSCGSILRLSSFMMLLTCLLNLIYVYTVNNTWVVVVSHTLIKSTELPHCTTILRYFLSLGEIHEFAATFWPCVRITVVFERYLILSDVNSTIAGIRLSPWSLTANLLFIMKASIC
jgi:hypothetical protein